MSPATVRNRLLLSLAALALILHLVLTGWALVQPAASSWIGATQTPLLLLFGLIHAAYLLGWRQALAFFVLSAGISWGFEQVGVATGWIYGGYHYSDRLQPKLGYVPLVIPVGWFMMMYPSYVIANLVGEGRPTVSRLGLGRVAGLSLLGGMAMTAWDLAIDPILVGHGMWVWEEGGAYFGVPVQNFAGWLVTTFTIYLIYRLWEGRAGLRPLGPVTRAIAWMPLLAYASQMVRTFGRPELGVIAFFAMGFPLLAGSYRLLAWPGPDQT